MFSLIKDAFKVMFHVFLRESEKQERKLKKKFPLNKKAGWDWKANCLLPQEGGHNSPLVRAGRTRGRPSKERGTEGARGVQTWPQPGDQGQHQWWSFVLNTRAVWTVPSQVIWKIGTFIAGFLLDSLRIPWKWCLTSMVFLLKMYNPNVMRKTSEKFKWKEIL